MVFIVHVNILRSRRTHTAQKQVAEIQYSLCLGITIKCISSYQLIISISCSYMFRQLYAILRELVCAFCVSCQFGFRLIKFCVVGGCVYIMWRPGACLSVNLLNVYTHTYIYVYIYIRVYMCVCVCLYTHTHISLALATKNKTEQCV
jgi:hypothetical protein